MFEFIKYFKFFFNFNSFAYSKEYDSQIELNDSDIRYPRYRKMSNVPTLRQCPWKNGRGDFDSGKENYHGYYSHHYY